MKIGRIDSCCCDEPVTHGISMSKSLQQHPSTPLGHAGFGGVRRTIGWVLLVGALGGLVGFVFLTVLRLLQQVLGPGHWTGWALVGVMVSVGLAVGLITRWLGSPGDVELLVDNIHVLGGAKDVRDLKSLLPVSLLCIAGGGAAGPEAPLVQTTGGIGSVVARLRGMNVEDSRVLTITGMAAGFTVLFGAPLGAAIFALEILHRRGLEYYEALMPAILGSLIGYGIFMLATGLGLAPIWTFPAVTTLHEVDILWAIPAGVVGAVVAIAFTYFNLGLQKCFQQLPSLARPILGGLVLGLLGAFWSGYALTFGEVQVNELIAEAGNHPTVVLFVTAALAKFVGSSVTISSGWRGGFIIPLFFIGASLGELWHHVIPGTTEPVVLMAALMVAINTGVTKTPIGSMLVVTEMAGIQLLPTTLIAAVISLWLTSDMGLIRSQRSRDPAKNDT